MSKPSCFQSDERRSGVAQHAGKVCAVLFRHSAVEQMAELECRYSRDLALDSG